jgi:hypothetical protein
VNVRTLKEKDESAYPGPPADRGGRMKEERKILVILQPETRNEKPKTSSLCNHEP